MTAPREENVETLIRAGLYAATRGDLREIAPVPGTPVGDAHLALDRLVAEVARLSGERDRANEEKLVLWRRWQDEIGERERLREALVDAEDTLRMYATGVELIGLRHRIVDALSAGAEQEPFRARDEKEEK